MQATSEPSIALTPERYSPRESLIKSVQIATLFARRANLARAANNRAAGILLLKNPAGSMMKGKSMEEARNSAAPSHSPAQNPCISRIAALAAISPQAVIVTGQREALIAS